MPVVDLFETWLECQALFDICELVLCKYPENVDFDELSAGHQQVIAVSTQRASVIVQAFLLTPERRELVREQADFVPTKGATSCPNGDLLNFFHQKLKVETFVKD